MLQHIAGLRSPRVRAATFLRAANASGGSQLKKHLALLSVPEITAIADEGYRAFLASEATDVFVSVKSRSSLLFLFSRMPDVSSKLTVFIRSVPALPGVIRSILLPVLYLLSGGFAVKGMRVRLFTPIAKVLPTHYRRLLLQEIDELADAEKASAYEALIPHLELDELSRIRQAADAIAHENREPVLRVLAKQFAMLGDDNTAMSICKDSLEDAFLWRSAFEGLVTSTRTLELLTFASRKCREIMLSQPPSETRSDELVTLLPGLEGPLQSGSHQIHSRKPPGRTTLFGLPCQF